MDELAIHEEAMRIRKMTDKQLVEEFHRTANTDIAIRVPDVTQDSSKEVEPNENTSEIQKLLSAFSEGKCKGIKGATAYKIVQFATEMGLI